MLAFEDFKDILPKVVNKYSRMYPHLRDDIHSVATLILLEMLEAYKTGRYEYKTDDDQLRHICSALWLGVQRDLWMHSDCISYPCFVRGRNKHHKLQPLIKEPVDESGTLSLEFREELARLPQTAQERQVLCLKIRGFTNREIATKLKCGYSTVCSILQTLKLRYSFSRRE